MTVYANEQARQVNEWQLTKDLLAAFGAARDEDRMDFGDGLLCTLRRGHGADWHKIEFHFWLRGLQKDLPDTQYWGGFPSPSISAKRPFKSIVVDLRKRGLEVAQEVAKEKRVKIAERQARTDELRAHMQVLRDAYPGLEVRQERDTDASAKVYWNKSGTGYMTGTLYHDGDLHLERVRVAKGNATLILDAVTKEGRE